uniref:WAP domain-containing protein n=1 Tax=Amblyomma maculatum TaxID=34609 RepID=G3MTG9_AMBMU
MAPTVFLLLLLPLVLSAGGQKCPVEYSPQCPSVVGKAAMCEVQLHCPAEGCQKNDQICCPVACGGCTCLNPGERTRRAARVPYPCPQFSPPIDGCEGYVHSNETCLTLNCKARGKTCCNGPCGDPFCV